MGTLYLDIRYRPARFGLCVRQGNWNDLRSALYLSHTLWGGRYNPLIPIDDSPTASTLIESFRIDLLLAPFKDHSFENFGKAYAHLEWPEFLSGLLEASGKRKVANFLDVYHPIRLIYEKHVKSVPESVIGATYFEWEPTDPLANIFLATFGAYPPKEDTHIDYRGFFEYVRPQLISISQDLPLKSDAWSLLTPSTISSHLLIGTINNSPGIYHGRASDFVDIVNFWNLRAEGSDILFYDPAYDARLRPIVDSYIAALREEISSEDARPKIAAYIGRHNVRNEHPMFPETFNFDVDIARSIYSPMTVESEPKFFKKHSLALSMDQGNTKPSVTFQLPPNQFFDGPDLNTQHFIVSTQSLTGSRSAGEWTFHTPYIHQLNKYYSRTFYAGSIDGVRVEPNGAGLFTQISNTSITLNSMPVRDLITRIFEIHGWEARPSRSGLIASRLIAQMGDLQKCRVFKIRGIRNLIDEYTPFQSFTRSAALQKIGDVDPATSKLRFAAYEGLYLKPRNQGKLTPEDAFIWLLEHKVFRAGLKLKCVNCDLDFWLSIDNIGTEVACEYCGISFDLTSQLRDRDWAYRRSGLFGRDDHQEGGIPVAVTLQQLETTLHGLLEKNTIYTTAQLLSSKGKGQKTIETDFVWLTQGRGGDVQLVIGECKSNAAISEVDLQKDIENLTTVAESFSGSKISVYILFSKTSEFTSAELGVFRGAHKLRTYPLILLSRRELEPYHIYDQTERELGKKFYASNFDDLAAITKAIYLTPSVKSSPDVTAEPTPPTQAIDPVDDGLSNQ